MTEPNPVGEPEVNQDPVGGGDPKPAAAEPFKVFATEEDFTAYLTKKTEVYERKMAQLRKENEALKQSSMTEAELAQETQRQQIEDSHRKALEAAERKADIKALLMARGLNRDQANAWASMAGDEWEDPAEAVKDLEGRLGVTLTQKSQPVAGGGGRNESTPEAAFTPEYVEEMIFKHGPGWYTANRQRIKDWQTSHNVSTIRKLQ